MDEPPEPGPGTRRGPLTSLSIVEFAGIGPAPYGAMLLADLGARVIRIDRPGGYPPPDPALDFEAMGAAAIYNRSRHTVRIDLKSDAGRALALRLIADADALIEGYRPGTMEALGLGPETCLGLNPRLVYARMTGWGQTGPLARTAGHDMNYLAVAGALSLFGQDGEPVNGIPPLVGDMGGGGLFMAFGLLAGVLEARSSGRGQVVDAAIVDGAASLHALLRALHVAGVYGGRPGCNTLDGGRHFYRTYRCADGGYVAVGAIEPAFRRVLLERLGLDGDARFIGGDPADEAYCTGQMADIFASRPRGDWAEMFADTDGCVTPILSMDEAPGHAHAQARSAFVAIDGVVQHAPSPLFGATPGCISVTPAEASRSRPAALADWGLADDEIAALAVAGVVE